MKKYLLLLFSASIILFSSCSKDDPEPDYIIGTWNIDTEKLENLPAAFKGYEQTYDASSAYNKIIFSSDKTYNRELRSQGLVFEDEGTWSRVNDTYTLKSDSNDEEEEFVLNSSKKITTTYDANIPLPDPADVTIDVVVGARITDTYVKEVKQ